MDALSFCTELAAQVSPEEWLLLKSGDSGLVVNEHNRQAVLEIGAAVQDPHLFGVTAAESVPGERAEQLKASLEEYLDIHMHDKPEGHKWIVLASLYLTFVAKRPMHPLDRVGITIEESASGTVYRCSHKVPGDNPICDSCVCIPK